MVRKGRSLTSDFDITQVSSHQSSPQSWPLRYQLPLRYNRFSCLGIPGHESASICLSFWPEDLLQTQIAWELTLPCLRRGQAALVLSQMAREGARPNTLVSLNQLLLFFHWKDVPSWVFPPPESRPGNHPSRWASTPHNTASAPPLEGALGGVPGLWRGFLTRPLPTFLAAHTLWVWAFFSFIYSVCPDWGKVQAHAGSNACFV